MKKTTLSLLCALLLLFIVGCEKQILWNGKTAELAELYMVEDVSDRCRYVGIVDYVFVGTVEEVIDIVLPQKIRDHEGYYSTYRIRVDRNIKGELAEEIVVSKMGGLRKDGTMYLVTAEMPSGIMIADAGLPEQGGQYIFLAYAQPDGSLTLSELFDNREYTAELLEEYENYCANEIVFDRERFTSRYDANSGS